MREQKKRKIIIGALCTVVLLMIVGYAAFSSLLNISGTAGIAGQWKVEITEITSNVVSGSPVPVTAEIGQDKTSATFDVDLMAPGDAIEYTIKVENKGNINATLTSMDPTELTSTNPAIEFTKSGLALGDKLDAGKSDTIKILVKYLDVTSIESTEDTTFTLKLTFSQEGTTGGGTGGTISTADDLVSLVTATGDGLYEDEYEAGRYIYRGANPNNYITFNNETWRIIALNENDKTLKIVRNGYLLNNEQKFDSGGKRTTGYCSKSVNAGTPVYGCNPWAATSNLVGSPSEFFSGFYYKGSVSKDAELNTYLNNNYYNGLSEDARNQIIDGTFNVGGVRNNVTDLSTSITQEAAYKWIGKVALPTVTEYVRASTSSVYTNVQSYYNSSSTGTTDSETHNWLFNAINNGYSPTWLLSPYADNPYSVYIVESNGALRDNMAYGSYHVTPVLHVSSTISLTGTGTSDNPYTITSA